MILYLYDKKELDLTDVKDEVMTVHWKYTLDEFFRSNTKNLDEYFKIIINEELLEFDKFDIRLNTEKIIIMASDVNYQKITHLGIKNIVSADEPITSINKLLFTAPNNILEFNDQIVNDTLLIANKKPILPVEKIDEKEEHTEILKELEYDNSGAFEESKTLIKTTLITYLLIAGGIISSLLLLYIALNL